MPTRDPADRLARLLREAYLEGYCAHNPHHLREGWNALKITHREMWRDVAVRLLARADEFRGLLAEAKVMQLQGLVRSLAERCYQQGELLSRRAER